MANNSMDNVITVGIIAAIGFGLYEWLKTACATGGSMAGSQICSGYNSLFTAAAPSAPSTSTQTSGAPAGTTTSAAASTPVQQTSAPAAPATSPSNTVPSNTIQNTAPPAGTCAMPAGYFPIATDMAMDPNGSVVYAPGCVAPGSPGSPYQATQNPTQPSVTAGELLAQATAHPVPSSGASFGGGDPSLNVDLWSYYYQQQTGTSIDPGTLQAAFPYLSSSNRGSMTASAFLNAIQGQGLAGLGVSPNLIPAFLIHGRARGPVGIPMGRRGWA